MPCRLFRRQFGASDVFVPLTDRFLAVSASRSTRLADTVANGGDPAAAAEVGSRKSDHLDEAKRMIRADLGDTFPIRAP